MRSGSLIAVALPWLLGVAIVASACGRADRSTRPEDAGEPAAQGPAAPLVARVTTLGGAAQSADEVAKRAGSYVSGLSNPDKALLGKALVDQDAPHYGVYGAQILVSVGEEQAAGPTFARFVLGGGDMTGFFWSWMHAADARTAMRMYINIADLLLSRFTTLTPAERERAQRFLLAEGFGPPITTFSEQAARDRIELLRREVQKPAPERR